MKVTVGKCIVEIKYGEKRNLTEVVGSGYIGRQPIYGGFFGMRQRGYRDYDPAIRPAREIAREWMLRIKADGGLLMGDGEWVDYARIESIRILEENLNFQIEVTPTEICDY